MAGADRVFAYKPGLVGGERRYRLAADRLVKLDAADREVGSWRWSEVGRVYWNVFEYQGTAQRTLTLEGTSGLGWKKLRLGCNRGDDEELEVFRDLCEAVYRRLSEEPEPPVFGLGYGGRAHWWFFGLGLAAVLMGVGLPVAAVLSGRGSRVASVEGLLPVLMLMVFGLPLLLLGFPGRRRAVSDAAAGMSVEEVVALVRSG